jgi:hypothetical protein
MPGDPKECREHARNCIELAEQAITAEGCATLINLANHWIKLAAELESAPAFLNALKDMELNKPKEGAKLAVEWRQSETASRLSSEVARRRKSALPPPSP